MISRPVSLSSPSKPFRDSNTSKGKFWVKPTDQMDLWLDSQGYYRKHTAKDGSCLYRAVSEQVFLAQAFHMDVRRQCADYAQRHPELLSSITGCSKREYTDQMRHPHEGGGSLELGIMSSLYRKDFLVFDEVGKHCQNVTNNGFKDKLMLCLSQDHHYDSVYTKKYISTAAFCQSLVYESLYKGVFELQEVDYAVKKMLHDKTTKYQRDTSSFLMNGLALRLEIRDSYVNVKELLSIGVTPFPYKVAKSLDPDIYRNVEYDTWNDIRRGLRNGTYFWNNRELQVGVKCLVKVQPNQTYHAHIQEMCGNKGPVLVFVEELGQKLTVPYENLELLPQPPALPAPSTALSLPIPLKQLRQLHAFKALTASSTDDHLTQHDSPDRNDARDSLPENTERDLGWRSELETDGRQTPKLKMFSQLAKGNKKPNKPYRSKLKEQSKPSNDSCSMDVEANSVVSSTDNNYEHHDVGNYQHENFQEFSTARYMHQQEMVESMEEERPQELMSAATLQPQPQPMLCLEQPHYFMDGFPHAHPAPTPAAYCYAPLPHGTAEYPANPAANLAEVHQPRFYYNYGMDAYGRGMRPTPPCYLNTAVTYVPDPNTSPNVYEHNSTPLSTPDSAVVMSPSPVGMYSRQRPDSLPVLASPGGMSLNSEPDTTSTPSYHGANLAPRFKNKMKTMMQGRVFESPLLQQQEVSSTTAPPATVPPLPAHYIPPAAPVYYHPHPHAMEYDAAAYCPTNYVEYGVYDPNTAVFYPPPHPFPAPAHFALHPDALFYPHLVTAPIAPFPSAV